MAWQDVKDSGGNQYRYWKQQKDSSCGVACVMMVIHLMKRKPLDEGTVRGWFGQAEGSANINRDGIREFDKTGSTQSPIISVLSKAGILAVMSTPRAAKPHVMRSSKNKPGILHISWGPGAGAHWVVVANTSASALVCLDPWYGLVEVQKSAYPTYSPKPGSTGTAGWFIGT